MERIEVFKSKNLTMVKAMKQTLTCVVLTMLTLTACSSDEPSAQDAIEEETATVLSVLNGTFTAEKEVLGSVEHEDITFTPFSTPEKYISLDGLVSVHGKAVVSKYYNDHSLEITHNTYYIVRVAYSGATPTLSFYQYGDNGEINNREDKRQIQVLTDDTFKFLTGGLSAETIYTKQ